MDDPPRRRHPMHEILDELDALNDEADITRMLDLGDGHPTKDVLTAFLYRLAKEHIGWMHLERMVLELQEADAFVLQNAPMAQQAARLATLIRRKK